MRVLIPILIVISAALLSSCATPPGVAQGKVASCDKASRIVAIHDEAQPGTTLVFSIEGADMGADPIPGDTVRIAYYAQGDKLLATRIMKISRQK